MILVFLSILFFSFKKFFSEKLKILGSQRQIYSKDVLKSIKQTFDGYRELYTYNYLELFQKLFIKKSTKLANNGMRRSVIIVIPKLILETLVMLIIVSAIGFMYLSGFELKEIILNITVYTVAGLRMFPVFIVITNAYQNLDYSNAAVKRISQIYDKRLVQEKKKYKKIKF